MKTLILFIVCGAGIGIAAWGEEGAAGGAIGGFCFWLIIKVVSLLNRHATTMADEFDDDD